MIDETLYNSEGVIAALDGRISYRQLDYWLRTGKITIRHDSNSQGNPRRFTQREVDAIRACLDQVDQARYVLAAFDAGRMFADAIAFGQPAKAAVNA